MIGPETKEPTCTVRTGFTLPVELTTGRSSPRRTVAVRYFALPTAELEA